jgi:hypothetical protein
MPDDVAPGSHANDGGRLLAARGDRLVAKEAMQIECEIPRRAVAALTVAVHGGQDDRLEVAAERSVDRADRRGRCLANDPHRLVEGLPFDVVRRGAARELVEHDAEGVDVGPRVDVIRIGVDLLGGHVLHGAHELPDIGLEGGDRQIGIGDAGDAEVDDLRIAGRIDEDVLRFQITVHDAAVMRVVHCIADPREELDPLPDVEVVCVGVLCDAQCMGDVLHDEVGHVARAVVVHARVVDLRNPRVVQVTEDLRFRLEAPLHRGGRRAARQEFQRDSAVRTILDREVDGAHPSRGQHAPEVIAADRPVLDLRGGRLEARGQRCLSLRVGHGSRLSAAAFLSDGSPRPRRSPTCRLSVNDGRRYVT